MDSTSMATFCGNGVNGYWLDHCALTSTICRTTSRVVDGFDKAIVGLEFLETQNAPVATRRPPGFRTRLNSCKALHC